MRKVAGRELEREAGADARPGSLTHIRGWKFRSKIQWEAIGKLLQCVLRGGGQWMMPWRKNWRGAGTEAGV